MTAKIELGVLDSVDGSAQWQTGSTKVLCSVTGPVAAKPRDERPDVATVELVCRPVTGLSNVRSTSIQDRVFRALSSVMLRHLHPRMLVQIVVQVVEPGEPLEYNCRELAAAINSAVSALIDASFPLQGVATAVSVAVMEDGEYIFDPDYDTLSSGLVKSTHAVAYEVRGGVAERLLLCESTGTFTEDQLFACIEKSVAECEKVYKDLQSATGDKIRQDFIWND